MLTIFSTSKPFVGHIGLIQRNAILSWAYLRPEPEIILFGREPGCAAIAEEFGFRHIPDVIQNEHGTPLVSDMFARARALAQNRIVCYVNADIILMSDFLIGVQRVANRMRKFLIVGRRWDVDLHEALDYKDNWEAQLRTFVHQRGNLHPSAGSDYFVYPSDLWGALPPFAIGRVGYDNWLIYEARRIGIAVVDASAAIMAVHQNHDYAHLPDGDRGIEAGPEATRNRALIGNNERIYRLEDATWLLTPRALLPALTPMHLGRRFWHWYKRQTKLRARLRKIREHARTVLI